MAAATAGTRRGLGLVLGLAAAAAACAGCPGTKRHPHAGEPGVTLLCAASTRDLVTEALALYKAAYPHVRVDASFAASSTLARQIEAGQHADLFLSASLEWVDYLESRGWLASYGRVDLLENRLVLIAPEGRAPRQPIQVKPGFAIASAFEGRVALANPDHVPAGIYARQALERLGWRKALEGRLLPALDVRDALRLVERGEVDLGIVYATDARASTRVTVVASVPADLHAPIVYPLAVLRDAEPTARDLRAFLLGPEVRALIERHGFKPAAPPQEPAGSTGAAGALRAADAANAAREPASAGR